MERHRVPSSRRRPAPSYPDLVVPVSDPVPDLVAAAWAVDPNHEGPLSDRPHPHRDNADERGPTVMSVQFIGNVMP
jgi:hypothetical protein